jgi:hypothetical protein
MRSKIMLAGLLLIAALCHAQEPIVDSALRDTASQIPDTAAVAAPAPIVGANLVQVLTVTVPTILGCLVVVLGAVQFVLKRVPTQESVRIQGVLGKVLDIVTAFQKDINDLGGVHKLFLFLVIGACLAMPVNAQSILKPEPKLERPPTANAFLFYHASVLHPTDSIVKVWRFAVNISPVGFTGDGVYHAGAGTSLSYQVQDYNYASQKYTVLRSYNLVWIPLVTGRPITSVKDFAMIGATYGWNNNLMQVGPFFYPAGAKLRNQIGVMAIIGLNLN